MAIKGKRKGKARSGRTVTAGPRPVYVPPKTPLFQRTSTKVLVVVLIEAAVFAILIGFNVQSEGEREREALTEFTQLVEAAMFQEGAVQQLPAGALVLPEMGQTISQIGTEEARPQQVLESTETWNTQAREAAERVADVRIPEEGLEPEQQQALAEAREEMRRGLLAYATLAEQVALTVRLEQDLQEDGIAVLQESFLLAGTTFDGGYQELQRLRREAGLPTGGQLPGGVPGGVPGGIPGLPGQPGVPGLPPEGGP